MISNLRVLAAVAVAAAATICHAQPVRTFVFAMPPLETNYFLGSAPLVGASDFDGGVVIDAYADVTLVVDEAPEGSGITSSAEYFWTQIVLPVDIDLATDDVQAPGVGFTGEELGWSGTGRFTARVPAPRAVGGVFQVPYFFTASSSGVLSETEQIIGEVKAQVSSWTLVVRRAGGCMVDYNGDGVVDNGDLRLFIEAFLSGDIAADVNGDGYVDTGDIIEFVRLFNRGCPGE